MALWPRAIRKVAYWTRVPREQSFHRRYYHRGWRTYYASPHGEIYRRYWRPSYYARRNFGRAATWGIPAYYEQRNWRRKGNTYYNSRRFNNNYYYY